MVPLPPGVPYAEQQFAVFDLDRLGAPDLPDAEVDRIAAAIRAGLAAL